MEKESSSLCKEGEGGGGGDTTPPQPFRRKWVVDRSYSFLVLWETAGSEKSRRKVVLHVKEKKVGHPRAIAIGILEEIARRGRCGTRWNLFNITSRNKNRCRSDGPLEEGKETGFE